MVAKYLKKKPVSHITRWKQELPAVSEAPALGLYPMITVCAWGAYGHLSRK